MIDPCKHRWELDYPLPLVISREDGIYSVLDLGPGAKIPEETRQKLEALEKVSVTTAETVEYSEGQGFNVLHILCDGNVISGSDWHRIANIEHNLREVHRRGLNYLNQQ